jgi:uncharacterized delta-60 repeat protein
VVRIFRFLEDGTPDREFGEAGVAIVDFGDDVFDAVGMFVRDDAHIVIVASVASVNDEDPDARIAMLTETGEPRIDYGDGGVVTIDIGDWADVQTAAAGPQNTIVLGGVSWRRPSRDLTLLRVLESGEPDPDFGENGIVATDVTGEDYDDEAYALTISPDGRIVVAACTGPSWCTLGVLRYSADGELETTFGKNGAAIRDFGKEVSFRPEAVRLQQDGSILVAATLQWRGVLLRFQGDQPTVSCGDPDFSDSIAASDALIALRSAVGIRTCLACLCDVNETGTVTANDALLILRSAVDPGVSLACSGGC